MVAAVKVGDGFKTSGKGLKTRDSSRLVQHRLVWRTSGNDVGGSNSILDEGEVDGFTRLNFS